MARRPWSALVPLTALAAGLLFATSAATAQGTDLRADRRLQLTELIARERADVERREQAAAELRDRVDQASAAVAVQDSRVSQVAAPDELELAAGLNNAFDKDPRVCLSCSLNGYDPGTYDVPGRFWSLRLTYRFD